jgi:hypothetical protein
VVKEDIRSQVDGDIVDFVPYQAWQNLVYPANMPHQFSTFKMRNKRYIDPASEWNPDWPRA